MICVYTPDCTDFSGNGIGPVSPLSCTVTETLNGEWELTLEHPLDDAGKWRRLVEGCILRAPVPAAMTPGITMEPLAEQAGTGLEVSLKKIPIRQETVEICNELDVNPYELSGNGSLLFVTDQGEMLAEQLQQQKIPAAVIGFLSADNDRVIVNGDERRFLEPANTDAIYRME